MQRLATYVRQRLTRAVSVVPRSGRGNVGSVTSFRETFRQRPRSGSAELLFSEIRNAFDPNSRLIQTWNQVVLVCILYEFFILPYIVVFDSESSRANATTSSSTASGHRRMMAATDHASSASSLSTAAYRQLLAMYVCEIVFCIDIYVQLNTGYYEEGNVLRDTRKSRLKYLKSGAFVLDVLALPPLALLIPSSVVETHGVHRALLEFHKLVRLRRLPQLISNLDDIYARYFVLLKLSKVLVTTLYVSHIVACVRFLFGYDYDHTNHWLPKAPAIAHGTDDHGGDYTPTRRYLMSLFWAFGMLSGLFEGELPHNAMEFVFTMIVGVCGFSLFTYLCATFFMLSKCEGGETETAEARVSQFKHLLAFHRVPEHLQKQAVEYLKRYYAQSESNDREASKLLCPSITVDIQIELLQETVADIPIFQGCDGQFVKAVTSLLEMVSYPAQFVLFRVGDQGDAMYVIESGVINTLVNAVKVRELRQGSFFGEVAVFANIPRSATMVTATYCNLYRLSKFHTDKLMEGYPRYAKQITATVKRMMKAPNPAEAKTVQDPTPETSSPDMQRRKSTRASFMAAVGLKRTKSVNEGNGGANSGKSEMRSTSSPFPHDEVPLDPSQPPPGLRAVQESSDTARASRASSPLLGSLRTPGHRPSVSRHLSWKDPGTQKVIPATSPTGKPLQRRSSIAAAKNGDIQDRAALGPKSISQLELLKNSLMKFGRGSIDSMKPDAMKGFYDQIQRLAAPSTGTKKWWSRLLLARCIPAESRLRMAWLVILQLDLCYNWITVPLQLSFPLFDRPQWYIQMLNSMADVVLWIDIYVNLNLSFSVNSETIFDTVRSAQRYMKSGHLALDVVTSLPYDSIVRASSRLLATHTMDWSVKHAALRIPRLLRIWRLYGHFGEVEEYLVLKSKQRLIFLGILLVMLYHIVACLHFSITYWEGFSPLVDAWIPSDDIFLGQVNSTTFVDKHGVYHAADSAIVSLIQAKQYFRSLYYATNVLAALGRTMEPNSERQYGAALLFMLSGFLITAIVVDNVQKRFTASALEQKEFFATRAQIQLFLKRQDAPLPIHQRVNSFLDYWWSSHRGAIIDELLEELPETIKRDIVRSICRPAMETIGMLFPEIWTESNGKAEHATQGSMRHQIEEIFLDNLRFVLYGQGEVIYRQGDYPSGLYFLLEGQICIEVGSDSPHRIPAGGYFGIAALDVRDVSSMDGTPDGHTEQATAQSGSIVVFVSREHLAAMQSVFPGFANAVRKSQTRLLIALRVKKAGEMNASVTKTIRQSGSTNPRDVTGIHRLTGTIKSMRMWKYATGEECFDPDSPFIGYWEMWIFAAMTAQSMLVIYHTCYGVDTGGDYNSRRFVTIDAIMLFLEGCFLLDMFIRSRLGFYEFGNKVMSLRQIKAHYIGSKYFMIDVLALLPFYLITWIGPSSMTKRIEIVNVNKVLRLFKSSKQFRALEAKHVKLAMELRLFRLVYYTFLVSHTFGCIWFDFAANFSGLHIPPLEGFGGNNWLPYASLATADHSLQYFASLFWSYGVMTASFTGELPKAVTQCLFSVVTMTSGFFLFAYVVGNFLDVIELQDSENRHFIAKLSSLRHLLAHFKLPPGIEGKFKTFFFFKRFHSITQEHVLERVLPPSLVVDIRMFQLQPMIVKVAFLAGMEDSVTRMLVAQFTQMLVVKDMYICKFGEEGKEMFFIFTGVLDIYIPLPPGVPPTGPSSPATEGTTSAATPVTGDEMSGLLKVNQITAGSYFGEAALFTKAPRNAYVKARTSCILYRLSRESLELVFERFPDWKQKVLRIVRIQQEQQRLARLASVAQEEDKTNQGGAKRRGLKRNLSRLDAINSRAQFVEAEVLANTRGGRVRSFSPIQWIKKKVKAVKVVEEWVNPTAQKFEAWMKLLVAGAAVQSPFYLFWLRLVTFSTVYIGIIAPYRCAYDDLDRWSLYAIVARAIETLCEIVFWWDIWFHFRVHDSLAAMELYEQDHLQAYKRERLLWDVLAVFPLELFVSDQFGGSSRTVARKWLRLNRCFKVANLAYYRLEVNRRSVIYELNRLVTLWMLYLMVIFWTSCAYFAVAMHEGFGQNWQAWLPAEPLYETEDTSVLMLRLFRGFSFALTAFLKKGKTFSPTNTLDYAFTVVVSFIGQLVMALMIGEVASIFILYIDNEVEFRKNHVALDIFMSRKRLSTHLEKRCTAFLTSWWSSHAGVNYQVIFDDLPPTVRTEGVAFIAQKPLTRFMERVFRPLTRSSSVETSSNVEDPEDDERLSANGDIAVENLMHAIAQHLHFEGYPRGEDVIVEGRVCRAVFFVVRGYLFTRSKSNPSLYDAGRYRTGDYFGEKGLLGHSVSLLSVTTVRACDLFVLRSEDLIEAIKSHPYFSVLFRMAQDVVREKKTVEEYFNDAINSNRRAVLRRRLSDAQLSNMPTPSLPRSGSKHGKRSVNASVAPESAVYQRVLQQCSKVEWEEAFRQFMEMIVPKGVLSSEVAGVSGDEQEDKGGDRHSPTLEAVTLTPRTKRAQSQLSVLVSPSRGEGNLMSYKSDRELLSPTPDMMKKRRTTSTAVEMDSFSTKKSEAARPMLAEIPLRSGQASASPTMALLAASRPSTGLDPPREESPSSELV